MSINTTSGMNVIKHLYADDIEFLLNTGVLFSTTPVSEPSMLAFALLAMRHLCTKTQPMIVILGVI